jgi:hypothetical protein
LHLGGAGCARPDLDGSGAVEQADQTLFDAAWELYGPPEPVLCGQPNDWCGGADLDRSGELDEEDQAFLEAARDVGISGRFRRAF